MTAHQQDSTQSLVEHLTELRTRIIRIAVGILVVMVILLPFRGDLYTLLAEPALAYLKDGETLISTQTMDVFLTPIKLCLVAGVFVTLPWILYQVWGFVAPGLYSSERRLVMPLLVSGTLLFYLGALFSYFVILKFLYSYLTAITPEGVSLMPDINSYFGLVIQMTLVFGIAFEVPIVVYFLVKLGVTSTETLAKKRRYVVVGAFFVGMILTPADPASMMMLGSCMWLLFEVGLWFARRIKTEAE